jgi:Poxvirus Late Transcription Factor VLTF3 like
MKKGLTTTPNPTSATTLLDGQHNEILNEFSYEENVKIPQLKQEKHILKHRLETNNFLSIEEKFEMVDRVNEINKIIRDIKNKKKKYLLENSSLIFEYFENKKNISSSSSVGNTNANANAKKMVNDFFKINTNTDGENTESTMENVSTSNNIVEKYLSNIDDRFINVNSFMTRESDICKYCFQGELIINDEEGLLICNHCFRNSIYLIENEKSSYKEPPKEVCFYAYKRINHFKEIIAQFQAKETTQIPVELIDNIKSQIKKERIELSHLTTQKTKEILKKLGYNKYYEHIPYIKHKLGITPPVIPPEMEDVLCNLFNEAQSLFYKFCPDDRFNFLSYHYTFYKLCELIGEKQYLQDIPMLKDREKRIEQDVIWKKICTELNWKYIPTN